MPIEEINLFKELKRSGFHSSVATTYSVDGGFYDGPVQRRLRFHDCANNILVADVSMLSRALKGMPETFAMAGQKYAVVPARVRGCFHSKLLLRLGGNAASLLIGSANMTARAWGANLEAVGRVEYRRADDPASKASGRLVRKAYDYLLHWLEDVPGEAIEFKLHLHHRDSPWLEETEANAAPVALPDGTAADLLLERGEGSPGIMHRLVELVDGEKVSRLTVVSPYWDDDLSALRRLRRELGMPPVTVALNPLTNAFPTGALSADDGLRFGAWLPSDDGRFVHAKLFVVSTDKADHVLFGSANCSDAALGAKGFGGTNAEASFYRRLSSETALPMLGLHDLREVDARNVKPQVNDDKYETGAGKRPGGQVEIEGADVRWWPAAGVDGDGARLVAAGAEFPVGRDGNTFSVELTKPPSLPLVVRFALADGTTTEPVLVHDGGKLLENSPGTVDRKTRRILEDIEEGKASLAELAQRAAQLFTRDPRRRESRGGGPRSRPSAAAPDGAYATPEEFREALEVREGNGRSGFAARLSSANPTLVQIFRLMTRGMLDVADPEEARRREMEREREANKEAREGEDEDGSDETPPIDPTEPEARDGDGALTVPRKLAAGPPAAPNTQKILTVERFEHRRRSVVKSLDLFERMLAEIASETGSVDADLPAQTDFALALMTIAVREPYELTGGTTRTLITFEEGDDREACFVIRAARILLLIWVGRGKLKPICERMPPWPRHGRLPPDVGGFLVTSRWVMARADAMAAARCKSGLARIVAMQAPKVFRASLAYGHVDDATEEAFVRQLDKTCGFDTAETDELLARMRDLRKQCDGALPATKERR